MANPKKNMSGVIAHEGYEAATGLRALERAGQNPQLKGVVHEVMFCDKYNAQNLLSGNHAALTSSPVAQVKDVVMTNSGRVVGHAQLKDVVSSSGVSKTVAQINSGKYGKTAIYGTEETAQRLAGKVTQKVHSSGISSNTTSRIADKALGRMPTLSGLSAAAKSGGVAGATFGAGIEAVSSTIDVINGKKSVSDAVIDVGGAAVKGGVTGAAAAAAGSAVAGLAGGAVSTAIGTSAGAVIASTGIGAAAVAAAPVVAGFAATCAVGGFISSFFDD